MGFTIGEGHVKPQTQKVEAIQKATPPHTKKQLHQFLGLVGYYSRFIPHFATVSTPLTDHLGRGHPEVVHWDTDALQSLLSLCQALCSSPMLYNPDFSCPFLLQTDAFNKAIVAVLCHIHPDSEHLITYLSRKLHTHTPTSIFYHRTGGSGHKVGRGNTSILFDK